MSGTMLSGVVRAGATLMLGPDALGQFTATAIKSIHRKRHPVAEVSSGQTAGLSNAFNDWEDRDPAAAGQYLLAMPQSAKRDSAISGFATGYAWQNPQIAITWANEISDSTMRQNSLIFSGQVYFRSNPDAARAWLETSGLPPEAQQQITNPRDRR